MKTDMGLVNAPAAVLVDFEPIAAINFGVLGEQEASATDSGLESVSCCNSIIATG
ncbi:hypothetical protein ACF07U_12570 [Streptomyces californicus]|uniref:hypothetical protein n=1 Tax=Streptomyces TaxID=1883 RepID=UPI000805FA52|nr:MULTISPECIES: hypothetical protein [Streptomyces]MDW4903367.1 hypothetical protein [Streptomyces californicus]QLG31898.1 hypothetical protein HXS80_09435 [Streptomyces sp. CB04723]SBU91974.1 hypothetical protein YW5DRAFT_03793 [Streptomyces sp. Ncost-T6T-1]